MENSISGPAGMEYDSESGKNSWRIGWCKQRNMFSYAYVGLIGPH